MDWIDTNVDDDMSTLQLVSGVNGSVIFPKPSHDLSLLTLIDVGISGRCALNLRKLEG
jgi:hypothetical protein